MDIAMHDDQSIIAETSVRAGSAAITSLVPVIGPIVHECLMGLLGHRQNLRMKRWVADTANRLQAIETTVNEEREETIAAIIEQAHQSARKTFHDEKLKALQNAIVNSVQVTASDDDIALFMALIDELAGPHIRALATLADYKHLMTAWRANARQGNTFIQQSENPDALWVLARAGEIFKDEERAAKVFSDLRNRGLVAQADSSGPYMMTREYVHGRTVTNFGRAFLSFISRPTDT